MNRDIPTFLKWAGGKRKILPDLALLFPKKIETYFEPFLGAGSVFFFIQEKYNPVSSSISDINKDLIDTYKAVKEHPEELMHFLRYFKKNDSEKFYYEVREGLNTFKLKNLKRSAAFIYLNKTCFNGLYRVNLKNEFNVPYGKYKNPEIYNPEIINRASKLLRNVKIEHRDYKSILPEVSSGDFVYLDPCYDPIKRTSFVQYTPEKFSDADRIELFKFMQDLKKKHAKVILSNNNVPEVQKLYFKSGFKLYHIKTSRSLGGALGRNILEELAISNY